MRTCDHALNCMTGIQVKPQTKKRRENWAMVWELICIKTVMDGMHDY